MENAKYGIPYGYLLNFVFMHFEVKDGKGVPSTTKKMPLYWNMSGWRDQLSVGLK